MFEFMGSRISYYLFGIAIWQMLAQRDASKEQLTALV